MCCQGTTSESIKPFSSSSLEEALISPTCIYIQSPVYDQSADPETGTVSCSSKAVLASGAFTCKEMRKVQFGYSFKPLFGDIAHYIIMHGYMTCVHTQCVHMYIYSICSMYNMWSKSNMMCMYIIRCIVLIPSMQHHYHDIYICILYIYIW